MFDHIQRMHFPRVGGLANSRYFYGYFLARTQYLRESILTTQTYSWRRNRAEKQYATPFTTISIVCTILRSLNDFPKLQS